MSYSYRCPKAGLDFCEQSGRIRCPHCGKTHIAHKCGADRKDGYGKPQPPWTPKYMMQFGRKVESWSDYKKAMRDNGIIDTGRSPNEHLEKIPDHMGSRGRHVKN